MIGREPCKKARDVSSISEFGFSEPAKKLVKDVTPEELILSVRTNETYEFVPCCDIEKTEVLRLVDEIEAVIRSRGFVRDDIGNHIPPECRFVNRYILSLGLMEGKIRKCMPYYESNEAYEIYAFSDERLERILDLLRDYLTSRQFQAVKSDLYDFSPRDETTIREAKEILKDNRKSICEELCGIFA